MTHARCRIGLHKWVRVRKTDPDLEVHGPDIEWFRRCEYCGRSPGDDVLVPMVVSLMAVVASMLVFWLVSPFLGAVMMIGAVGALGVMMVPPAVDRVARWLSGFR